jgi:Dockerin type I domain
MSRALSYLFAATSSVVALLILTIDVPAQTVWSGFDVTFTKANNANPSLPENQDRITDNIWLTRDVQTGLLNIHDESSFNPLVSPVGTEWATYINNPNDTIAATNYANLTFAPWIEAYGGQGGMSLPGRLTGGPAVLYLVTDDIYLDLQFTAWTSNAGGGGFSYDRAAAPALPPPTGDYNHNGVVDAADYVVWRNTLNQPAVPQGSGADGNANGTIDAGDYDFWRSKFGNAVGSGSELGTAAAVSEPATGFLMLVALLALRSCRRRR